MESDNTSPSIVQLPLTFTNFLMFVLKLFSFTLIVNIFFFDGSDLLDAVTVAFPDFNAVTTAFPSDSLILTTSFPSVTSHVIVLSIEIGNTYALNSTLSPAYNIWFSFCIDPTDSTSVNSSLSVQIDFIG